MPLTPRSLLHVSQDASQRRTAAQLTTICEEIEAAVKRRDFLRWRAMAYDLAPDGAPHACRECRSHVGTGHAPGCGLGQLDAEEAP